MDKFCRALSFTQKNTSSHDKDFKNNKDIIISKKIQKSLDDWKLPPSSSSYFSNQSCILNFSCDRSVKTVEKEIPLSEGYASFPLFTDNLQRVYENEDLNLRMGIIQVGLKPTKLGSSISATICLRDKRRLKFHRSLLGMVESSLSDGPIYFSYFPTQIVSFSDPHLSSTFTIDIKTQGDGNMILMYRFHYKVVENCDPIMKKKLWSSSRSSIDEEGETTLFVANVGRGNRVSSKRVYWDQVSVPERWMDENKSNAAGAGASSSSGGAEQGAVARIDWKEAAGVYALKVCVPGFRREEVKIEVEADRSLVISGERRKEAQDGEWQCVERSSGKFLRRMTLPEDAKMDEMKAAMENGVLTVTVPIEDVTKKRGGKVIHIA